MGIHCRKERVIDGNAVKSYLLEHYLISSFFLTFGYILLKKNQCTSINNNSGQTGFKVMIYTVFNIIQPVIQI